MRLNKNSKIKYVKLKKLKILDIAKIAIFEINQSLGKKIMPKAS